MANYVMEGDGLYPLDMEANTDVTTFTAGDIPSGASVVVGISTQEGWVPLPNGTLQPFTPVALSHGHDAKLSVLVNSAGAALISVMTQKEGVPSYFDILNQIATNTASPIKVDAPADGLPYLRIFGGWLEGISRTEFETRADKLRVDIVYGNNNSTPTVTDENVTWTLANINTLSAPPQFINNWTFNTANATFTYVGTEPQGYEINAGGLLDSDSTTDTDHLFVRMVEPTGIMTGTTKRYAAGRSPGQVTSSIGFTLNAFGLFNPGDVVTLEVAKDFVGTLIMDDLLVAFRPIN